MATVAVAAVSAIVEGCAHTAYGAGEDGGGAGDGGGRVIKWYKIGTATGTHIMVNCSSKFCRT